MHQSSSEEHRRIVAATAAAADKLPRSLRGSGARAYLAAYYANVEAEDLAGRPGAELATMALLHRQFAEQRRGRALVRVFNPRCATTVIPRRIPSSRWSTTTCPSWWTPSVWHWHNAR
jgi:hypothetical protein